jgi:hypothetical protein
MRDRVFGLDLASMQHSGWDKSAKGYDLWDEVGQKREPLLDLGEESDFVPIQWIGGTEDRLLDTRTRSYRETTDSKEGD